MLSNSSASIVANQERESRFISKSDIQAAFGRFKEAQAALDAAQKLTANSDMLIGKAIEAVEQNHPSFFDSAPEKKSDFASDLGYFMKCITSALVAGDECLISQLLSDFIKANPEEISNRYIYLLALKYIRQNHELTEDSAIQADKYIDCLIAEFS